MIYLSLGAKELCRLFLTMAKLSSAMVFFCTLGGILPAMVLMVGIVEVNYAIVTFYAICCIYLLVAFSIE